MNRPLPPWLPGALLFAALLLGRNLPFWRHAAGAWRDVLSALPAAGGGFLARAAAVLAFFAAAGSVGAFLLRRAGFHDAVAASALGAGLFASAVFALGSAGLFSPAAFLLLLGFFLAAGAAATGRPRIAAPGGPPRSALRGLLGGLLLFAGWHAAVSAASPPVLWDALAYHLAIPKLYVKAGEVVSLPWLLHSRWPHLWDTLYAVPLSFGDDVVPAMLHAAACGILVYGVFRKGREAVGAEAGWIAAALFAAQPAVLEIAGTPHADGAFALFHFAAASTLWAAAQEGARPGAWVAAGFLSGLGAACKLHGLATSGLLGLWVLVLSPGDGKARLKHAAFFGAAALAPVLPWLVKAAWTSGSPVWPFFSSIFGGDFGAAAVEAAWKATNRWSGASPAGRYGPHFLLVPAVAGVLLARREALTPFVRFLLWPLPFYALLVAPYNEAWRFLMPFYPALSLAAAGGLAAAFARGGVRRAAAAGALIAGLWPLAAATQNNALFGAFRVPSRARPGVPAREVYLERRLDVYRVCREASRLLKPGDKVLLFREIRGYYLDVGYVWGDPVNQRVIDYDRAADAASLAALLRENGVTHVLINRGRYPPSESYYTPRVSGMMEELLSRAAAETVDGPVALYRLAISG